LAALAALRIMMPLIHPAVMPIEALLADCDVERLRRSGPGGQHRNKVETAVRITHRPTGVRGEASERRSQEENRRAAVQRLRINLALECRGQASAEGEPSAPWQARFPGGRLNIRESHEDFPALLVEALDAIEAADADVAAAAKRLGTTTSQLVKFLQRESRAMLQVNQRRAQRGLGPLR
jgi:hypothetical protein